MNRAPGSTPTPHEIMWVGGLFLVATVAIAYLFGAAKLPLDGDNEHYFFMAERFASGFSPYLSHFESKNALSMLLTGIAISVGRDFGMADLVVARLLSLAVLAISLWLTWWLTNLLTGSRRAAAFASLAMIGFSGFVYHAVMGSRPKVFLVLFMLLTMLLFAQRRHFWAGVSAALAFLCWQPALLMLGVMVLALLVRPGQRTSITRALAGAVIPVAVYEVFFWLDGSIRQQLVQTYYFPAKYMRHELPGMAKSWKELVDWWVEGFGSSHVLPLVTALGLLGVAVLWLGRLRRHELRLTEDDRSWLYVWLCFASWLAFTLYDHQGYMDLFVLLPFVAIIGASTVDRWLARLRRPLWEGVGVMAVLVYFGFLIAQGPHRHAPDFTLGDQQALAARVGRMLAQGERIYAIECTHLLAFNHAENWNKFAFFFRGVGKYLRVGDQGRNVFRLNRAGERPTIVLVSHHVPREIRLRLRASYCDVTDEAFERQGIRVYQLKSNPGARLDS